MENNKIIALNAFGINKAPKNHKQSLGVVLDRFIESYITYGQIGGAGYCLHKEINYLSNILEGEKEIHLKNNESIDKITNILQEELKKEEITQEERRDVYRLLSQVSSIHRESQLQKAKHVTSRLVAAMGIAGTVAISLGSLLIHEKYKTLRERDKNC